MLVRYSCINNHLKRELLLLQGKGCVWKKCTFCDYYEDTSNDRFNINKKEIDKITGVHKVVDVINSGSIFELDKETKKYISSAERISLLISSCRLGSFLAPVNSDVL